MHPPILPTQMTDTKKALPRTFFQCLINRPEHMTALSNWGPYALRRSVNKFSSSALGSVQILLQLSSFSSFALGKINKFLLLSLMRRFQHTPKITIPKVSIIPMVGDPKRQGCATLLRYRSGYHWRTQQVILSNYIL